MEAAVQGITAVTAQQLPLVRHGCNRFPWPAAHKACSTGIRALQPLRKNRCAIRQHQQQVARRRVVASAAAVAAASSATTAVASFPALQCALAPALPYIMAAAAACCAGLVLLMVVAPSAALTQRSVRSNLPLVLLAAAYGVVLLASWSTDTLHLMMPGSLEEGLKGGFNPQFFPTLQSVQTLFGRPFTAASFLLHALAINLIAARSAYIDGLSARVPTTHSVLLSSVVGPLGLLSHQLTKAAFALVAAVTGRDVRPAPKPTLERSGQGTITIMPYDK